MNRIFTGDSASVLTKLSDTSVDLTVTSPPYDNLRTYGGYSFDFEAVATQLYRVTKVGGVVVWVVADAGRKGSESGTSFRQALFFKEIGFNLHDTMIYEKLNGAMGSPYHYLQTFEYMFVFSKGVPKTVHLLRDRKNVRSGTESVLKHGRHKDGALPGRQAVTLQEYGRRKNIWSYAVGGGRLGHPAVFPIKLAQDHILSWSNENDVVLDPFLGSGTTAVAAKSLNRQYIGIEVNPAYIKLAEERLANMQLSLVA